MLCQIIKHLHSSLKTAFVINDQSYSYDDLRLLTERYYGFLAQHPEIELIGISSHNDIFTYAFLTAVVLSNCGYVILNLVNPVERNALIAKEAGINYIVSSIAEDINSVPDFLTFITLDSIPEPVKQVTFTKPNPDSTAYVLFTSGSTGKPKGVRITKKNLNALLTSIISIPITISENDKVLQMFDLTFDGSVLMLFLPLCAGATIYPTEPARIKYLDIVRLISTYSLTFVFVVPSVISLLKPFLSSLSFPSIKTFILGAEAVSISHLNAICPSIPNADIWNLYGPTEGTVCVTAYKLNENVELEMYNGLIPIGKPLPGVEHLIIDEGRLIINADEMGELYIGGEQVTEGYVNDEERNRQSFIHIEIDDQNQRFYATGDIVYRNKYGNYMYCGRKDRQVKVNGNRIELSEIECYATQITGHHSIAMVKEIDGLNKIYLFVEAYTGDKDMLIRHLEKHLPSYMIPQDIINLNSFPLNNCDKIDFNQLYKQL